jgi:hypothetical protein
MRYISLKPLFFRFIFLFGIPSFSLQSFTQVDFTSSAGINQGQQAYNTLKAARSSTIPYLPERSCITGWFKLTWMANQKCFTRYSAGALPFRDLS